MTTKNTQRRDYLIIRRILRGDYPSQQIIAGYLGNNGCAETTSRTFQRDLENIRSNFDLDIQYDARKGGYSIDSDSNPEFDKVLHFIELAEASNMVLSTMRDRRDIMQYLSFSPATTPLGTEHLPPLLQATQRCNVVKFGHTRYETGENVAYQVEPYLLKEFDGRWYLFAYVPALGAFRTFGLDRLADVKVTDERFTRDPKLAATAEKFDNVYGLVYEPGQNKHAPVEEVRIRLSMVMLKHIAALPLHHSQTINGDIVSLRVIINPEIGNKIMSYGEHAEVLAPEHLRTTIRERLKQALEKY